MNLTDFLKEIEGRYPVTVEQREDVKFIAIRSTENGNYIGIEKDDYGEYIVFFATQHWHICDPEDVQECIINILNDEALPIEFYDENGKDCFGGDITRTDFAALSMEKLNKRFGFFAGRKEYLAEIRSWSGRYDVERCALSELVRRAQQKGTV